MIVANNEREQLWEERVGQWKASGLSQRAFAMEHGYSLSQVGYWIRRLGKLQTEPALLPVRVAAAPSLTTGITLRGELGWTLNLPADVPASWLADLLRAL